ncbi:hypothetical protein ALC56_00238, partial [Trachymyrmex septentrionalis]
RQRIDPLIASVKAPDYSAKNSTLTVATQNQPAVWRTGSHTFTSTSPCTYVCSPSARRE